MCMCVWTGYIRVHIHVCTYCIANISVATTSSVRIHNMQTRIELSVGLSRAGPKQRGLHNSTPHTDHMLHKFNTHSAGVTHRGLRCWEHEDIAPLGRGEGRYCHYSLSLLTS